MLFVIIWVIPNAERENLFIINSSIILKSQIILDQNIMLRTLYEFLVLAGNEYKAHTIFLQGRLDGMMVLILP